MRKKSTQTDRLTINMNVKKTVINYLFVKLLLDHTCWNVNHKTREKNDVFGNELGQILMR